jgi:hypothetical protein
VTYDELDVIIIMILQIGNNDGNVDNIICESVLSPCSGGFEIPSEGRSVLNVDTIRGGARRGEKILGRTSDGK